MTNPIKPPIGLIAKIKEATDLDVWTEDDGLGDPWLGLPYSWNVKITVTPQMHSSHATQTYMAYDALDVKPGMWLADFGGGKAVKITSIDATATTSDTLVCVIEDVDRFNTFADSTQGGISKPDMMVDCFIFDIGKDGLPVFGSASQYASTFSLNSAWTADILSHFRYRNLYRDVWKVYQPGHAFALEDVVYLDSDGKYYLADGSTKSANRIIGSISSINTPGNDWFTIKPIASITSGITPALPGNPGDLIYVDYLKPR